MAIRELVESDAPALAKCWYGTWFNLVNPDPRADFAGCNSAVIERKPQVLIQRFGRTKGLLGAVLEWDEPSIGKSFEDVLALVRGPFWRHVMTDSGRESWPKV